MGIRLHDTRKAVRVVRGDLKVCHVPLVLLTDVSGTGDGLLGFSFVGIPQSKLDLGAGNGGLVKIHRTVIVLVNSFTRVCLGADRDGNGGGKHYACPFTHKKLEESGPLGGVIPMSKVCSLSLLVTGMFYLPCSETC